MGGKTARQQQIKMYWRTRTRLELANVSKQTPVLLPIAAIEQHGDHLPVDTDLIINEHFCRRVDAALPDSILIAPPVAITCSGHHADFAGTLTVTHSVLFDYLQAVVDSIIQQGFLKIIIFNSHGGNQAIGQSVVESAGLCHPAAHLLMVNWWKLAREKLTALTDTGFGGTGHACEFETSLVAAIAAEQNEPHEPLVRADHINPTPLEKTPAWAAGDLLHAPSVAYHRTMRELTGDGVFGDPSAYSAQKGEAITRAVVDELKEIVTTVATW